MLFFQKCTFSFYCTKSRGGKVISWYCLPYFLSSRAICVSSVGCIRPGRYDTSAKPVPYHCFSLLLPILSFSPFFPLRSFHRFTILSTFVSVIIYLHQSSSPLLSSCHPPTVDRPDPAWWWHFTHANPSQITCPCGSQSQSQGQDFCWGVAGRLPRPARWP